VLEAIAKIKRLPQHLMFHSFESPRRGAKCSFALVPSPYRSPVGDEILTAPLLLSTITFNEI